MIVEAFITVAMKVAGFFVGLLGTAQAPSWINSMSGQIADLVNLGSSVGAWVPWSHVGIALAALLAAVAASFLVRVARIAVSLFTGGGGSAA